IFYQIALAHYHDQNPKKAIRNLKLSLKFDEDLVESLVLLGQLYSQRGQSKQAIEQFKEALYICEQPQEILPLLCRELHLRDDITEAIYYLKQLLLIRPEDSSSSELLFELYDKHKLQKEALRFYTKLCDDYPFNAYNWYCLGILNKERNRLKRAIKCFEFSYFLKPDFIASYHELATLHSQHQEYSKAIEYLLELVELEEPYAYTYTMLAELYRKTQQVSDGLFYAYKAVKEDPQYHKAWFELGLLLKLEAKSDLALKAFDSAIQYNENKELYYVHKAQIYTDLKDWPTAHDLWVSIINRFGMRDVLLKSVLLCCVHLNEHKHALDYAEEACEISKDVDFLYYAAYFNHQNDNQSRAIDYFTKGFHQDADRLKRLEPVLGSFFGQPYIQILLNKTTDSHEF
ncbi:MAG: tetratricopeptide repeat protein, partial [Flavobacteriales bacterium]